MSRTYEDWKSEEAAHRKESRKKKRKALDISDTVRQLWDRTGPPIKFDNLIAAWQRAILRFHKSEIVDVEERWNSVTPYSRWSVLDTSWRSSLRGMLE